MHCCVVVMGITRRLHVRKSCAIVVSIGVVVLNAIHAKMFMIGTLASNYVVFSIAVLAILI